MGQGQGSLIRSRFEDELSFIKFSLLVRFFKCWKSLVPGI